MVHAPAGASIAGDAPCCPAGPTLLHTAAPPHASASLPLAPAPRLEAAQAALEAARASQPGGASRRTKFDMASLNKRNADMNFKVGLVGSGVWERCVGVLMCSTRPASRRRCCAAARLLPASHRSPNPASCAERAGQCVQPAGRGGGRGGRRRRGVVPPRPLQVGRGSSSTARAWPHATPAAGCSERWSAPAACHGSQHCCWLTPQPAPACLVAAAAPRGRRSIGAPSGRRKARARSHLRTPLQRRQQRRRQRTPTAWATPTAARRPRGAARGAGWTWMQSLTCRSWIWRRWSAPRACRRWHGCVAAAAAHAGGVGTAGGGHCCTR